MAEVFVPLNRFQSVITTLTGERDAVYTTPDGISTIILSAQLTNVGNSTEKVTLFVDSNRDIPVPDFTDIFVTGSFVTASFLINNNLDFIVNETFAYLTFQNNLREDPIPFEPDFYRDNIRQDTSAVSFDISNNTTIRTRKAALSYYDKNGITIIPEGQISASVDAVQYSNELVKQILLNQSVTGSTEIDRLFQTTITQSIFENITPETGSEFIVTSLYSVIKQTIENPKREPEPQVELVSNVEIPIQDSLSPVIAGKLVLEEEYALIVSGSPNVKVILSILESANE